MSRSNLVHIIDDDPILCDAMQMLLATVGFDSRTYVSAPAFLEQVDPQTAGCVVSDVHMPQMTGIELLGKLKEFCGAPPVILMTGVRDASMFDKAMKAGAVDLLTKPVNANELIASLSRVLGAKDEDAARGRNVR